MLANAAAAGVASLYGFRSPEDCTIEELAMAMNILVVDAPLDSAAARMVRKGSNGLVRVSDCITSLGQRRFAIAHEIGHFVMHEKQNQLLACTSEDLLVSYKNNPLETEASIFAGALLMPTESFREQTGGRPPRVNLITQLADTFETTLTSTALRFVETSKDYCVFVVSEEKRVRWWRASRSFEKNDFWMDAGSPIPRSSAAAACFADGLDEPVVKEVARSSWFPDVRGIHSSYVLEQAIPLKRYNKSISLIWLP